MTKCRAGFATNRERGGRQNVVTIFFYNQTLSELLEHPSNKFDIMINE